ncbi:type III secretion system translocon subunit SctB [Telmatospirillum sp. J64-1]|uniref:type III secretion system translocon subunit SctB n=1 Tax=Telmatospirillum sp. J64-1 TaxID=2502183 RepID=UPI00115E3929|nr:type III secretion system translocon subunit SctB [Telmatospirillum sp. J64-1]
MSDMRIGANAPGLQRPDLNGAAEAKAAAASEKASQFKLGEADLKAASSRFLALSQGDLQIPNPNGKSTASDELNTKLDSLSNHVAGDIFTMMALFQKLGQEMRTAAREERLAETQIQMQALGDAANKMREAAQARLTGAIIQGTMQIAGGIAQGMGAMAAGGAKTDSAAQINMQQGRAASEVFNGIGAIANGICQFQASLADADKADLDKLATLHGAKRDQAQEMMQAMRDLIKDIQDKLAAIEQSSHDTNKSIVRA